MLTILGSLLGFGTSIFPSILEFFQDGKDKKHELAMQATLAELNIREAEVSGELANVAMELKAEMESVKAAHAPMVMTGVGFIDGLRGSVRPICTYWFMALYSFSKYEAYVADGAMWTEWDQALLATILSFWFGDRMRKFNNANR
tara:strand:- start:1000 stop:1434 length:435 start_codon:yes stop_codon:yes gene_type:complete